jgi:hypothetical protein
MKPEDYLEAFAEFVRQNKDKIEALSICSITHTSGAMRPSLNYVTNLKEIALTRRKSRKPMRSRGTRQWLISSP